MKPDELIALVVMLAVCVIALAIYIALIVLGVRIAKRKNRSPHWMWFAIHPVGLIVTLIVMACIGPLRRCPHCGNTSPGQARLCAYCGYAFALV